MDPIKLTSAQKVVADYLSKGSTLTNVVALAALGVGSLSSRISELRKLGFIIKVRREVDERTGKKYTKYDFNAEATQPAYE
jgi:hypothetical protein